MTPVMQNCVLVGRCGMINGLRESKIQLSLVYRFTTTFTTFSGIEFQTPIQVIV